jgi:hypothetical protein
LANGVLFEWFISRVKGGGIKTDQSLTANPGYACLHLSNFLLCNVAAGKEALALKHFKSMTYSELPGISDLTRPVLIAPAIKKITGYR